MRAAAVPRFAELLLAAAAVTAAVWFLVLAAQRVGYPFELEWMEGGMVDHAARVRQGLPLYCAPTADHVCFLYTPLLYWCGAAVAIVTGDGFLPLRLVSTAATLGCAGLLLWWVRLETRRTLAGILAAGLFFAGYAYVRTWYDLARNDTLMLLFVLATAALLRTGRTSRTAVLAAAAATLAFLAKQSALPWLVAIGVGALLGDRRRGVWFAGATALLLGATVLALALATDGWFTFFVFAMPSHHGIQADRRLGFFTEDLVPILPMVAGALWHCVAEWRAGRRGDALFLAAFGGGGLVTSYASRLHQGGWDNVMVFALAAGCALLPMLLATARRGALVLLTCQFVLLAAELRRVPVVLPREAHRAASEQLLEFVREQPGDVWLPFHGWLGPLAGKPAHAHAMAMADLVQAVVDPVRAATLSRDEFDVVAAFHARCTAELGSRRFAAIVLAGGEYGAQFETIFQAGLQGYRRSDAPPVVDGAGLQPAVGMAARSPYVLVPR